MKRINLLPRSFIDARRGRRRGIVIGSLCGVLAWSVGLGAFVCNHQLARVDGQMDLVRREIAAKQKSQTDRVRMEERKKALEGLVALRKVADVPLQPSAALAALFDLQPETIVLSKVLVEPPPAPAVETPAPVFTTTLGAASKRKETPRPLTIEINGYAMSDLDAAKFVGSLTNHPAFDNVMLSSSKRVDVSGTGRFLFQIRAEIPSDRKYVVETASAGQAAADGEEVAP